MLIYDAFKILKAFLEWFQTFREFFKTAFLDLRSATLLDSRHFKTVMLIGILWDQLCNRMTNSLRQIIGKRFNFLPFILHLSFFILSFFPFLSVF